MRERGRPSRSTVATDAQTIWWAMSRKAGATWSRGCTGSRLGLTRLLARLVAHGLFPDTHDVLALDAPAVLDVPKLRTAVLVDPVRHRLSGHGVARTRQPDGRTVVLVGLGH